MTSETAGERNAEEAVEDLDGYRARGFAARLGFGVRPAVLVVDFMTAFTDSGSPLGSDLESQLAATARLLEVARAEGVPRLFTVTAYDHELRDAGHFIRKIPSLEVLRRGEAWTELDPRLAVTAAETVVEKQYASAFFGTSLASTLTALGVDTVLVTGCTTSGCIRATAVDAMQHGFRPMVVEECVGDRAPEAHRANLLDMDAKYADVVSLEACLDYLREWQAEGAPRKGR